MTERPRILSISFSGIRSDARVLRQIAVLAEKGDVTTVGYGPAPDGVVEHIEIAANLLSLPQTPRGVALLAARRFKAVELGAPGLAKAHELLAGRRFDLVVANEARALPLAHAVAHGAPVWGDMHEWAPEERTNVLPWRILVAPFMTWVCATYLPLTAAVSTVNASIAKLYDERFDTKARVVRNSRSLCDLAPSPLQPGRIRLAHSGVAVPGRDIDALISATLQLDERFTLDLYLMRSASQEKYWQTLHRLAAGSPRITFNDPVPPGDLPRVLNQYDVGVFLLPPDTTNHRLMLPNKFFDFVQARLAIVFSPAPETDRLIAEHNLGVVTAGFTIEDLVASLSALTAESVERYKQNAHRAAGELSSIPDEEVQRTIIDELLRAKR